MIKISLKKGVDDLSYEVCDSVIFWKLRLEPQVDQHSDLMGTASHFEVVQILSAPLQIMSAPDGIMSCLSTPWHFTLKSWMCRVSLTLIEGLHWQTRAEATGEMSGILLSNAISSHSCFACTEGLCPPAHDGPHALHGNGRVGGITSSLLRW